MDNIIQFNSKSNNSILEDRCKVHTDLLITSVFGHFQNLFGIESIETMYNQALLHFESSMSNGYIIEGRIFEFNLDLWSQHTTNKNTNKNTNNKTKDFLLLDNEYHTLKGIQHMYKKYCEKSYLTNYYDIYDDLSNEELFQNICYHQMEDYFRYLSNQKTKFKYPSKLSLFYNNQLSSQDKFELKYS